MTEHIEELSLAEIEAVSGGDPSHDLSIWDHPWFKWPVWDRDGGAD